jgi:hypothetical protein
MPAHKYVNVVAHFGRILAVEIKRVAANAVYLAHKRAKFLVTIATTGIQIVPARLTASSC